jgi:hypothetical protein
MSSVDVVASVLQDLTPELNELFTLWHPLLDTIVKNRRFELAKGNYREFRILSGGPGAGTKLLNGDELLSSQRRQNYSKGNQYASRSIYLFDIPGKDMAEVSGSPEAVKALIRRYPESALQDVHELLSGQIARGSGSSGQEARAAFLDGVTTLNGLQDYNPDGTARDGVFMAAAPASQTQTVFGVPMRGAASNPISGWYHQYNTISSFGLNGREQWRKTRDDANAQGGKMMGKVDLILTDPQQYQNYQQSLDEHVETVTVTNDHVPSAIREGIKFGPATVFSEQAIDISDTTSFSTAATQAGVAYFINTAMWEGFHLGEDDSMETKGLFSFRGPMRVPDLDAWRWEIVNYWNIYAIQLRNQGFVTGGATK